MPESVIAVENVHAVVIHAYVSAGLDRALDAIARRIFREPQTVEASYGPNGLRRATSQKAKPNNSGTRMTSAIFHRRIFFSQPVLMRLSMCYL